MLPGCSSRPRRRSRRQRGRLAFLAGRSWDQDRDLRLDVGAALDPAGAPATDLLLSADPAGFEHFTGHGGVVTPNDSLAVIHVVAADYGTRWLVLERAHIVTPLIPILEMKPRPDWIGRRPTRCRTRGLRRAIRRRTPRRPW